MDELIIHSLKTLYQRTKFVWTDGRLSREEVLAMVCMQFWEAALYYTIFNLWFWVLFLLILLAGKSS